MNVEQLVREALQEEAAAGGTPRGDLTDRVLTARRRRNRRGVVGAAAVTAAAIAVAVTSLPGDGPGRDEAGPASGSLNSDVIGHPDQSPPRDLIAAGNTAVSGYYTTSTVKQSNGDELFKRRYTLLNRKTGTYEKADEKWAWADVAPGMRTAAVLEGELPARRIGLLDLATGEVERWITPDRPVAGVEWSPDGKRLVATSYSKNPDRLLAPPKQFPHDEPRRHGSRTGFYVIDAGTGEVGPFHALRQPKPDKWGTYEGNPREDLEWSHDGTKLYTQEVAESPAEITDGDDVEFTDGKEVPEGDIGDTRDASAPENPSRHWYTLDGEKTKAPAGEKYAGWPRAGLSPDGKLLAGDGDDKGSPLLDPKTGRKVGSVPGMQQLAWADNKRLIAWACATERCAGKNEYRTRLVMVTVGKGKVVPLSDFRKPSDDDPGRWTPLLTAR
ncbi:WD40 repeat domain-containing protein [Streptomyces sp. NPDC053474]|uniref:WD40 repeat domain-containing protein n=1 Tax=Streptomyces sp. NPDC053474 TaxID=3365704 RepID=UPI0037D6ABC0